MKKRTALSLAISMAISYPGALNALGLGELQSSSQLNQPLSAQINLLSTNAKEAKQLQVKLASADVFSRVGIDRPAYLDSLNFRTAIRNGKPVILVSSDKPVKEPFLNFLLEVSWPQGQLLKEYTVLLDPPILVQSGTSTPDTAASVRAEPQSSGVVKRTDNTAAQRNQQQAQQSRLQQQQAQQSRLQQQQAAERRIFDEQAKLAMREEGSVPRAVRSAGSSKKYRVKSGDTMYKVASNLRYRGTTNNQMMIALFKANPHAFGNNNINHLNVGKVLVRPSLSEVKGSSRSAAKKLVKQHYAAWQKYRSGLATTATAQIQTAEPTSNKAPNKSSTTIPKQVGSANKPNLTVVGSGAESTSKNGGTASAALQKKLLLAEEALASSKSKSIELESRVSKLEAIVRKKDRLITLKNERLARLESQMSGEGVAAIQPASINPVESEGIDLAGQVGNEIDQGNDTILRGSEPTTPTIGEPVVVEKTPEVETANIAPTEVASTDMANAESERLASPFVSDVKDQSGNGLLELLKSPLVAAIGGGSLLALILGGLFLRRRQTLVDTDEGFSDTTDEDFDVIDDDLDTDTDFEDDFDTTLSDYQSDDSDEGDELDKVLSSDSSLEDDEVLQEADVYIVYGLHEQAEDELKKAIKAKPEKLEYRYKLLENYQVADDAESFVAGAKDFLKTEGDNKQELWDKVLDLGKKIAPENDMFSEKSATKAASVFAGVAASGAVAATTTGDTATNPVSTNDFESMLNDNSGLDDLDLSGIDNDDFNFDADADTNPNLDVAGVDANVKDDLDLSEFLDSDDTEFQSNFDLDDLDSLETDNNNVLNFNADSGKDLTSLNLELDTDSGIDKVLPAGGTYGSGQGDSGEEDALSFLNLPGDDQEMQDAHIGTKLDLARAYLDMGDVEGARCTLEEVVVEGNDAQKREAQEMLQQTG